MKISEVYPTRYVMAADLQGRTVTLTISHVTMEEMMTHDNKKENKPVAWFERTNKGFVMNATNARTIAALYGDDTDSWVGQRISIYPTQVKAFGKLQDCIRVREEIPAIPRPVNKAQPVEEQAPLNDDVEDLIDQDYSDGDVIFATEPTVHAA